ncbi:MAG: rhomboid family intramembrane serine protease [Candidatus Handelsmanbacteria bacterium]|nr:rhomboid family intramembrane serine protease [Candidatus Handelsmanbacteria bacterium]
MPAILCPSCRKLIDSTEPRCPFCGQLRPGMWGFTSTLRRLGVEIDFSKLIVIVCAVLYVLALIVEPSAIFRTQGMMNFLAPGRQASVWFGMTGSLLVFDYGYWWTLITAIYLHGNLLHIFFNMMWVRQLGPLVEDLFGPYRLFVIFTVAGVTGFLFSSFSGTPFTLGASGSIFGLLAAAIVYGRRQGSSLFTLQFLQWAVILFVFGFIFPGVDNWAHLGGFVGGYATAFVFSRMGSHEGLGAYLVAGICALLTVGAFVMQAWTMFDFYQG